MSDKKNREETVEEKLSNDKRWDRIRRMVEKGARFHLSIPGPNAGHG